MKRRRGFTLVELLVVILIIATLAAITLPVLMSVQKKGKITRAKGEIARIVDALATYQSEYGRYPRRPGPIDATSMWANDNAWAWAALVNYPQNGGGKSAPYGLGWQPESSGTVAGPEIDPGDDALAHPSPRSEQVLDGGTGHLVRDDEFQREHLPSSSLPLAFIDPWGNPYQLRVMADVPDQLKANAKRVRTVRYEDGSTRDVIDRPHAPNGVEVWSCGPNGTNEWGAGDDVYPGAPN